MRLLVPSSLLALSLWAGAGCKTPRSDASTRVSMDEAQAAQPNNFEPASSNSLGVGDLVEVRVFQEADLSGAYRISSEGTIDFPLCGKVTLSGTSASEAADALKACLAGKYLKNPQVTVLIREYNSKKIFVFGEVNKPGTFPYDEKMSIVQAITLAGGFTRTAAQNNTHVTRQLEGNKEQRIRVPVEDIGVGRERNFQLRPGDIIFVPESFF